MTRFATVSMLAAFALALAPLAAAQDTVLPPTERSERTLSEILAGVRGYPPEMLALLAELGDKPQVLEAIARNPQVLDRPELVEGENADAIRDALKRVTNTPELAAIAASFPEETRKLAELLREAPEGTRDRIVELRLGYGEVARESARAWEELLRKDPVALGEYRDLLTRFSQEQRLQNEQFAAVQVTNRDYYVALPPNDMIMQYAIQNGAPAGIARVLERWWDRYAPEQRDRRVMQGQIGDPYGPQAPSLAEADRASRAGMFKSIDSPDPASVGLAPIILQPAADQPEDARFAFAMMEHARLWSGPVPEQPQQPAGQPPIAQADPQPTVGGDTFVPDQDTLVIDARGPEPIVEADPIAEASVDAGYDGGQVVDTLVMDDSYPVDTIAVDGATIVDAPDYTVVDSVYSDVAVVGGYSSYYSGWPGFSTYRRYFSVPIYTSYGYSSYPYGCWPFVYVYANRRDCGPYYWRNYGAPYRCDEISYANPFGGVFTHRHVTSHRHALLRNYHASLGRLGTLSGATGHISRIGPTTTYRVPSGVRISSRGTAPRGVTSISGRTRGGIGALFPGAGSTVRAGRTQSSSGAIINPHGSRSVTPRTTTGGSRITPRSSSGGGRTIVPRSSSGSGSVTPRSATGGSRTIVPRSPSQGGTRIAPRSGSSSGSRSIVPPSSSSSGSRISPRSSSSGARSIAPRSGSSGTRSIVPRSGSSGSHSIAPRSSSSGTRSIVPRSSSSGSRYVAPRSGSSGTRSIFPRSGSSGSRSYAPRSSSSSSRSFTPRFGSSGSRSIAPRSSSRIGSSRGITPRSSGSRSSATRSSGGGRIRR